MNSHFGKSECDLKSKHSIPHNRVLFSNVDVLESVTKISALDFSRTFCNSLLDSFVLSTEQQQPARHAENRANNNTKGDSQLMATLFIGTNDWEAIDAKLLKSLPEIIYFKHSMLPTYKKT